MPIHIKHMAKLKQPHVHQSNFKISVTVMKEIFQAKVNPFIRITMKMRITHIHK